MIDRLEAQNALSTLLDAGVFAVLQVDPRGVIIQASGRVSELLGRPILPRERLRSLLPLDVGAIVAHLAHHAAWQGEVVVPAESPLPLALQVVGMRHGDDLLLFLQVELAELARAAAELRHRADVLAEEEERYRLLVEGVKDYAIFALDPEGRVLSWNEGAEAILGYREVEVIGAPASIFHVEEDRAPERLRAELETVLREGRYHYEGWRARKDGSRFWADVVLTALRTEGHVVGYSKIVRDLTERRQLEDERARVAILQEMDALKNQFLGILSHELRTPINAITGFGSILDDGMAGELSDAQRYYLGKMLEGADHLLVLVDDLLDMSRIQVGRFFVEPRPVDLVDLVAHAVAQPRLPIADRGQAITVEVPAGLPPVWADEMRLLNVLVKLLHNASKFTPVGGSIWLRARREGDRLRCEVTDSGCGVAASAIERIFRPFTQENMASTRAYGGTGLGLSICKAIIEAHGGAIGVESEPERGATFWFTLALCEEVSG